MKKLFLMLVGVLMLGTTAKAQTDVILRGGFATNTFVGDDFDNTSMSPGYNIGLELNNYFHKGLYWNTGILFGSRGYEVELPGEDLNFRAHNFQIPLTIGYKYNLGSGFALDGRIGAFFSVDMAGKQEMPGNLDDIKISDIDNYHRCDGGLLIGIGVWYQKFNLDFAYQRGFAALTKTLDEGGASNFWIRLGYAF